MTMNGREINPTRPPTMEEVERLARIKEKERRRKLDQQAMEGLYGSCPNCETYNHMDEPEGTR